MKKFYLTTAIDYANGSPHLGHAYEKVLSDVIVRHRRLLGVDVHFFCRVDGNRAVQRGVVLGGRGPRSCLFSHQHLHGMLCVVHGLSQGAGALLAAPASHHPASTAA